MNVGPLNLLIGANAAGKSNILDALRFLAEGFSGKDFSRPLSMRGGPLHLAWKGEPAQPVELKAECTRDNGESLAWKVAVDSVAGKGKDADEVSREEVILTSPGKPPSKLLSAEHGEGWWWSGEKRRLKLVAPTGCALSAAMNDPGFLARDLGEFVTGWAFFDPDPQQIRRPAYAVDDGAPFDMHGRNLAQRLFALQEEDNERLERVVKATRDILGLPNSVQPRHNEEDGRYYFVQREPGLEFPVIQAAVSSGTLRVLAFMLALFGEKDTRLVGIEEPENYVHPKALADLAETIRAASEKVQVVITTHSPLLLSALGAPEAVRIVRRDPAAGTLAVAEGDPASVASALEASGFGLGEYYETQGFGA
ncbi:MAG: AAA family ATPase [Terriglobales bacterium]